jgi:peptidoglycan-associated lipoprotein
MPEPIAAAPPPPAATPAEPARPAPAEFTAIADVKPIYFDFDQASIRPDDAKILEANAEWLKTNANTLVLIEGHCDERGTSEYNLVLGERRAQAARNSLISSGIAAERISIVSFGAERPVCTEGTEECWAKNRRAAFLIRAP